jgi:hypothetical protein
MRKGKQPNKKADGNYHSPQKIRSKQTKKTSKQVLRRGTFSIFSPATSNQQTTTPFSRMKELGLFNQFFVRTLTKQRNIYF